MNVRTALISSALLLAVLGWACEQQGPASPSALATPGGGSLGAAGGVSLDAAGGAIVGVKPCDDPPCKPKDDGGKKTFVATMTTDTGFPDGTGRWDEDDNRFTITTPEFPVDNKCNSENIVLIDLDTPNRIHLTQLELEVRKCRMGAAAVKVWVVSAAGTRFATHYMRGEPSLLVEDSVTFHVHKENERFFRLDDTMAFRLNIADIKYTLVR